MGDFGPYRRIDSNALLSLWPTSSLRQVIMTSPTQNNGAHVVVYFEAERETNGIIEGES